MPSQTRHASTLADAGTGGTLSWSVVGTTASVSFSGSEATSNWLYITLDTISIPSDATNRTVTLVIECYSDVANRVLLDPYILFGGVVQNDSFGSAGFLPTTDTPDTHFPLDLSGYTPAQINSGIEVALRAEFHNDFNVSDATAYITNITQTISYDTNFVVGHAWHPHKARSVNRRIVHRSSNRRIQLVSKN